MFVGAPLVGEKMRNRKTPATILALFWIAIACNDHGLIPLDRAIDVIRHDFFVQTETNKVDILWIIDNSSSMCQEQNALTENFDAFIEGLAGINADFRLAVTTTDMDPNAGDLGRFRDAPRRVGAECSAAEDNCPTLFNPDQSDADDNGIGDACEGDDDGDGVDDHLDNCVAISNPGQEDADGNGLGDACESASDRDSDGDGVMDNLDNCALVFSQNQNDADGDGVGDACEGDLDGDGAVDPNPLDCPDSIGPVLDSIDYQTDPENPTAGLHINQLQNDFRCIATVGTQGSGFEKGLSAMQAALSDAVNADFRRQDAWLVIIFVTDENDCSDNNALELHSGSDCEYKRDDLVPVENFIDFLLNFEGMENGERILVAGIIGPDDGIRYDAPSMPSPSCSNPEIGDAYGGYRYEQLIDAFGERGVEANICHDDFDVALDSIARVIRANLATKCLRRQPPICERSLDCPTGETCTDPGDVGGINVCSGFSVSVEMLFGGDADWTDLVGSVMITEPESGNRVPENPDADFAIDFEASSCTSGIGIEFTEGNAPGPDDEFRVSYPISLDATPLPL
jgi:hypothetical protein